jgi:hypothetical protein
MERRHIVSILFFALAFLLPQFSWAHPLFDAPPSKSIGLTKNQGSIGFSGSYMHSDQFFNDSGSLENVDHASYPGSNPENYHDANFTIRAAYGVTDALSLWFDFPLVYRKETESIFASDWGMGDIQGGLRYMFYRSPQKIFEIGFDLNSRFPSGDTDVHFSDPTRGRSPELPLGTGNQDLSLGLASRTKWLDWLSVDVRGHYNFRFSALVEYLRAPATLQISADQSQQALLPTGNLEIDWGDEIFAEGRLGFELTSYISILAGVQYLYRQTTDVENFTFEPSGNIVRTPQSLPSSYLLTGVPTLLTQLTPHITLLAAAEIPIAGENSPTFALVESLTGYKYRLEVAYVF